MIYLYFSIFAYLVIGVFISNRYLDDYLKSTDQYLKSHHILAMLIFAIFWFPCLVFATIEALLSENSQEDDEVV